MSAPDPALVVIDHAALIATAGLAADKCLYFAKLIEANAAIDRNMYPYFADLARGAQHLIDAFPNDAGSDLAIKVARLENALDIPGHHAAAA